MFAANRIVRSTLTPQIESGAIFFNHYPIVI